MNCDLLPTNDLLLKNKVAIVKIKSYIWALAKVIRLYHVYFSIEVGTMQNLSTVKVFPGNDPVTCSYCDSLTQSRSCAGDWWSLSLRAPPLHSLEHVHVNNCSWTCERITIIYPEMKHSNSIYTAHHDQGVKHSFVYWHHMTFVMRQRGF